MGSDDLSAPSALRACALRLGPGDDLRAGLEAHARRRAWPAACILTCVGSLVRARLRLAGAQAESSLEGPFEIVSLVGTLSPDGPHLHVALADARGANVGGHVLAGCVVHTTAELVVGVLEDLAFARALDPRTGWKELLVRPR